MENKKVRGTFDINDVPEGEEIYLRKDFLGWRVVFPWKNKDGKINWVNFLTGGTRNAIFTIIVLFFVLGFILAYNHDVNAIKKQYQEISDDPIAFCRGLYGPTNNQKAQQSFLEDLKKLNLTDLTPNPDG